MNFRRLVPVLIGVVLISFALGIFSLLYNDNYSFTSLKSGNFLNVKSRNGIVKIGSDGIEVKDGDDNVSIGWDGIKVTDGDDEVDIGWNGIKVNESGKSRVNISKGWNWGWFGINSKDLKWETIDEEKFAEVAGISNITISSSFIDVKVTSADRDNVRIHYYGKMKTNVVPSLEVDKRSNTLNIKLESNSNSYSIEESDVVLEIFVPKSFNGDFNASNSSGDIYMKDLIGKDFNISASSGSLNLENLDGKKLDIDTSSGDIQLSDSIGEIKAKSSSGNQELENVEANQMVITASSGNVSLEDCIGELRINTSSGRVSFNNKRTSGDIVVSTTSGDVSFKFKGEANYSIKGSSSSGRYKSNIDMKIEENEKGRFRATIGSGEKSIDISTSSGDVEFY
ncbi:DUF4097 family beta strand repeat-containing protein [Tissierella sp.]|uniref:DUF4097 family beta strand repeat-containing protein n=1 Tax=Tissierella sp. TaxID=41274 RepID=UPI0028582D99|nr:DUF4097 family beta strand repeat-containing protein [Tissierella sp.]MDR7857782.1 DUF4097 family beta strand repeat-containing protein [Tissierella sp.]